MAKKSKLKSKPKSKPKASASKKSDAGMITKDMLIADVVAKNPDSAIIMMQYGLHCIGCHVSANESLGDGARAHGLPEKYIDEMVEKINAFNKKK